MAPYRLNDDQRLLYEALADIWLNQSRKVVICIAATLAVALGIVIGVLMGTRQTLRQTAAIASGLHQQVEQNRALIEALARDRTTEQQRYQNVIAAFESVRRRAKGQR